MRAAPLSAWLAVAWIGLIIYASLYPLSGWRDPGLPWHVWIGAPPPRYWTAFEVSANVAAYVPAALFAALALRRTLPGTVAAVVALLLGCLLSLACESLQMLLPHRVPSNLDWAANTLGSALGAFLAALIPARLLQSPPWHPHLAADSGRRNLSLTVLALWLFTLANPDTLLFGTGNLRTLITLPQQLTHSAEQAVRFESAVIVLAMIPLGVLLRQVVGSRASAVPAILGGLLLVLGLRTLVHGILLGPENQFAWLTPGARYGLPIGLAGLTFVLLLPTRSRAPIAAVCLMAATLLANLTPDNPYAHAAQAVWQHGHFLHFHGITRALSALWPFMALPALMLASRERSTGMPR